MIRKNGNKLKMAGIAMAAALVIGGLGMTAVYASTLNDVVAKGSVVTVPNTQTMSDTKVITQGTIQYSKGVYARADGSQKVTYERWYNPETKENRSDIHEYSSDGQLIKFQSTYLTNDGNDMVIIQRDNNGEPLSGTIMKKADQPTVFEKLEMNLDNFASDKEYLNSDAWTSIGIETTSEGKTLNKILKSYQSYINDTTQADMQLIEFIDPDTGLSAKSELYENSTGENKLFSSETDDYGYVTDDGNLFKTDIVTLTPAQGPTETLGK